MFDCKELILPIFLVLSLIEPISEITSVRSDQFITDLHTENYIYIISALVAKGLLQPLFIKPVF